jgi:ribonucleases P/MRP protein subunit RPP40
LDSQKAFDTVPHKRLMRILKWYGIDENLYSWIKEFFSQREMRLNVEGVHTKWNVMDSGIPQGSVLGPLLFVLYVNDITTLLTSSVKLFANETKIWRLMRTEEDERIMRADTDKLNGWSDDWLLRFNTYKCKQLATGNGLKGQYFIGKGDFRKRLVSVSEEKDLGVLVTSDLKWNKQCNAAASQALKALSMMKKTFNYLNKVLFLVLYGTYVRPHLEYCIQVWAPYYRKDIHLLEKVQERARKLVKCISKLNCTERQKYLGLYLLERRGRRGDLIETYKILTDIKDTCSDSFFQK